MTRRAGWRILALGAAAWAAACAPKPPPQAGPAIVSGGPAAVWTAYRARELPSFKMRHEVETHFQGRTEVVEGFLLLQRPARFWVRAQTPFGTTLFDVKQLPPAPLAFDVRLPEIEGDTGPRLLARDIERIYLATCPPDTAAQAIEQGIAVECALHVGERSVAPIDIAGHPSPPDDRVRLEIDDRGLLRQKIFSVAGTPTARVTYTEYQRLAGLWWAQRITLAHQAIDYALTIQLIEVDPRFDVEPAFLGLTR